MCIGVLFYTPLFQKMIKTTKKDIQETTTTHIREWAKTHNKKVDQLSKFKDYRIIAYCVGVYGCNGYLFLMEDGSYTYCNRDSEMYILG